ncbi:hypothetical protein NJB1907f44_48950 [Mycobacterium marinum]|uniref:hypothetical protein n=1 Tax=Mycobacterium marinum TaxID=1781 RepID=UPI000E3E35B7|nr:hypothetical protein [Mycobacterium marinum]RFZ30717.1 hypothetical protein KST_05033 [Mycobacterium marinum]GJN99115.1 hypothetical protein NJB1907E8_50300 [Mycobacterium marinum]GJO06036.1 hypothetical protein NJB1907E90_16740 [Mycobacterium marinum]GJO10657.1 hypothetical protein NJB1808e29_46620 [Mycobacterium marinum]GJO14481.1 hypothetical protein NJB1907f34b_50960 [Mycobacterium marinum]
MSTVVARSRIREAALDLLAPDNWESWPVVVELVGADTGASAAEVEAILFRLWRAGKLELRGRGRRRQIKARREAE